MKVLQINNHHRIIGGADQVFFNTADLLRERGHVCDTFAARDPRDRPNPRSDYFPAAPPQGQKSLRDLPSYLYNFRAGRAIGRYEATFGPYDIAHLHIYYGRLTTAILPHLRKQTGAIIQSLHEYKLACPVYSFEREGHTCRKCVDGSTWSVIKHRCKNKSLAMSAVAFVEFHLSRTMGDVRHVDRFICVSAFQREILIQAGLPKKNMVTLYNFVDVAEADIIPVASRDDYLLYFGRIEALKGIGTLIEAAKRTGQRVVVAGHGSYLSTAQAMAEGANIEFVGFQSGTALRSLVANARAVVVPSEWYENCPMSVLEAKALGVPVIGTKIGGIPELVRDGIDGFLVEPGDLAGLAEALVDIGRVDLDGFSSAARQDAVDRFSSAQHYKQLMAVYKSALN